MSSVWEVCHPEAHNMYFIQLKYRRSNRNGMLGYAMYVHDETNDSFSKISNIFSYDHKTLNP